MPLLFKRPPQRVKHRGKTQQRKYVPGFVVADVTVALTGQSATVSQGTLVAAASYALTGSAATTAAGTLIAAPSQALTGSAATTSAGTLVPHVSYGLTGTSATSSAGTVTASNSQAITGQSATTASGTLVSNVAYGLTGQEATSAQGNLNTTGGDGGDVTRALTGESVTTSQGTLTSAVSYALTGQSATSATGTLINAASYGLTGLQATTDTGTLGTEVGGDVVRALVGEQLSVAQGNVGTQGGISGGGMVGGGSRGNAKRQKYKNKQRKILVTVDDETFAVSSEEEAQEVLRQAVEQAEVAATAQANKVVELRKKRAKRDGYLNNSPIKIDTPAISVVDDDSESSLTNYVEQTQQLIHERYKRAAEIAEIALLVQRSIEIDNDEAAVLLLLE